METTFAYCCVAISPVRGEHKDSAEMVSQLLFGEVVVVKEKQNNWIYIQSQQDQYEGWIDEKQIIYLSEKDAFDWLNQQITTTKNTLILGPFGKQSIPQGSYISKKSPTTFSIGNQNYTSAYKSKEIALISFAKTYLNTPYLWGGKSNAGIDCSGFSQIVYRSQGIELPRDASQQVHLGNPINRKQAKAGDLAFFTNDAGKVIHVGILLSKSKIIHASGRVKIDKLDDTGIWSEELNKYSHNLYLIKRFL
jgi:cell wall-associated NlpC family hydrolase